MLKRGRSFSFLVYFIVLFIAGYSVIAQLGQLGLSGCGDSLCDSTENPTNCPQDCGTGVCAKDVKQCPDGSYVVRVPPNCEFQQCPTTKCPEKAPSTCPIYECVEGAISVQDPTSCCYKCKLPQECKIGGCSGEICGESSLIDKLSTICVYKPEYACYKEFGKCELQTAGKCGWTPTEKLVNCLKDRRAFCGNNVCETGEDSVSCPSDCKKTCADYTPEECLKYDNCELKKSRKNRQRCVEKCPELSPPLGKPGCTYEPRYDENRCIVGYDEICVPCPEYAAPYCPNDKIISGGVDENGCPLPPKCEQLGCAGLSPTECLNYPNCELKKGRKQAPRCVDRAGLPVIDNVAIPQTLVEKPVQESNETQSTITEPQYLIFQLFTFTPTPEGKAQPFNRNDLVKNIDEIFEKVENNYGDGKTRQLGFSVGPLALDYTDDELRTTIKESFKIAEEKNIAVAFHIDDSMFWLRRVDLWKDKDNVEWSDWSGTVHPRRFVGWAPTVLAPQMCYESPTLRKEISRIAKEVIGVEVKKGVDSLKARNKEHLFAGVIAGWETHLADHRYIDKDNQDANRLGITRARIGYCSLSKLGFSEKNPPKDFDVELEDVVHDWAEFWAKSFYDAGIPKERIYTHTSYVVLSEDNLQPTLDMLSNKFGFKANPLGFTHSSPKVAFNEYARPGISTYAAGFQEDGYDGAIAGFIKELKKQGNPPWASAEGTNTGTGGIGTTMSWEGYLGELFNNGAALVNIFAWQEPEDSGSPYGKATRSQEAIEAYKQFLRGETLVEGKSAESASSPSTCGNNICESNENPTNCPADCKKESIINVISAVYGANCGAPTKVSKIADACNGKAECTYTFHYVTDIGYDPAYGCAKDLKVEYSCSRQDDTKSVYVAGEAGINSKIALSCGIANLPPIGYPDSVDAKGAASGWALDPNAPKSVKLGKIPASAELIYSKSTSDYFTNDLAHIYVSDVNGARETQITFDTPRRWEHMTVSYDRRYIAANEQFLLPDGRRKSLLWLFDLEKGTEAQLLPAFPSAGNGGVAWDSQGYIYFAATVDGNVDNDEIHRIKFDGTGLERLTHTPEREADVGVSEDGLMMAYVKAVGDYTELWVASSNGSNPKMVYRAGTINSFSAHDPELLASNTKIVFSQFDGSAPKVCPGTGGAETTSYIWIKDINDTANQTLKRISKTAVVAGVPNVVDGRITHFEISCSAIISGKGVADFVGTVKVNGDGSGYQRIKNGARHAKWIPTLQPKTSPSLTKTSNGKIAFVTNRDGNDEIYIMNSDGTGATRLTDNTASDNDPNWSPDGTKIVFRSERGGGSGIYVMNADGSDVRRISPTPAQDSQPTWSPDGTKIAFTSTRDSQPEIYVMDADGSNVKRLTYNAESPGAASTQLDKVMAFDAQPTWSPGKKIVFWSNRDGNQNLYSMNSDGSGLKQLTFTKVSNGDPAWSPDGTKISFASNRDGTHPNIYVMNANGSSPVRLTNFADPYEAGDMSWSPDGTKLTFQWDARGASYGEVWVMTADGSSQMSTNQKCDPNNCAPRWQP